MNKLRKHKKIYTVVELAYHDDYLSGVNVVCSFTNKADAERSAKLISNNTTNPQYNFIGKVYKSELLLAELKELKIEDDDDTFE